MAHGVFQRILFCKRTVCSVQLARCFRHPSSRLDPFIREARSAVFTPELEGSDAKAKGIPFLVRKRPLLSITCRARGGRISRSTDCRVSVTDISTLSSTG